MGNREIKEKEYRELEIRLDKASEYFATVSRVELQDIENTKAYKVMAQIIKRLYELHRDLYN